MLTDNVKNIFVDVFNVSRECIVGDIMTKTIKSVRFNSFEASM